MIEDEGKDIEGELERVLNRMKEIDYTLIVALFTGKG
jgi:hypothetical protein